MHAILTTHKPLAATFLHEHYESFFGKLNALIGGAEDCEYVTRRQSIKLLGDVLLESENRRQATFLRYLGDDRNLQVVTDLLLGSESKVGATSAC